MESSLFLLSQYQLNSIIEVMEDLASLNDLSTSLQKEVTDVIDGLQNSESILVSQYIAFNEQQESKAI